MLTRTNNPAQHKLFSSARAGTVQHIRFLSGPGSTTDQALRPCGRSVLAHVGSSASTELPNSIFDLASSHHRSLQPAVAAVYLFGSGLADCLVTTQLEQKFGVLRSVMAIAAKECIADI